MSDDLDKLKALRRELSDSIGGVPDPETDLFGWLQAVQPQPTRTARIFYLDLLYGPLANGEGAPLMDKDSLVKSPSPDSAGPLPAADACRFEDPPMNDEALRRILRTHPDPSTETYQSALRSLQRRDSAPLLPRAPLSPLEAAPPSFRAYMDSLSWDDFAVWHARYRPHCDIPPWLVVIESWSQRLTAHLHQRNHGGYSFSSRGTGSVLDTGEVVIE